MKTFLKIASTAAIASTLAIAPTLLNAPSAAALPANGGMSGSYLGGGVSVGINAPNNSDAEVGGHIQGRVDLPTAPVSVRGSAVIGGGSAALVPMVSVDLPIAPNTNLYAGAGYSFVLDEGEQTPLGDRNSVVLSAGAETAIARNIALYGDVKLGIDAFENSNNSAVSFQLGAAYRF